MIAAVSKAKPDRTALPVVLGAVVGKPGLILIRRNNEPFAGLWGLPGGKVRPGEHLDRAAEREVFEEAGVRARFEELCGVVTENVVGPRRRASSFLLLVCRLKPGGSRLESSGEGAVRWFGLDELTSIEREMIPSDRLMLEELVFKKPEQKYFRCRVGLRAGRYRVERFQ